MKKSIVNVKKIFEKRGYTITEEGDGYIDFVTGEDKQGKIIWSTEDKEGKKYLTDTFKDFLQKPQKNHIILVYNNITNPALKIYTDYFHDFFDSELLHIDFLQKFIFDHPLVPDVSILSEDEAAHVAKTYGGEKLLPYILTTDPVAITLNLKPGQIIEEKCFYDHSRKIVDKERPPIVTYRLVIKPS